MGFREHDERRTQLVPFATLPQVGVSAAGTFQRSRAGTVNEPPLCIHHVRVREISTIGMRDETHSRFSTTVTGKLGRVCELEHWLCH